MSDEKEQSQLSGLFTWRGAIIYSDLEPLTRLTLLTLSLHMSEAGDSCFPSLTRLENETGLARSTVVNHLTTAKVAGWIDKTKKSNGKGHSINQYYSKIPPLFWVGLQQIVKGGTRPVPRPLLDALTTWQRMNKGATGSPSAGLEGGPGAGPGSPSAGHRWSGSRSQVVRQPASNNSYNKTNNKNMGDTKKSLVIFCDTCKQEPYSIKIGNIPLCVHCAAKSSQAVVA